MLRKKWKSILIIISLVLILAGTYFWVFYKSYQTRASALDAIPTSAGLILQIQNPYQTLPKIFDAPINHFFDSLSLFSAVKNNFFYLDTLLNSSEKIYAATVYASLYASAHNVEGNWSWLFTINPNDKISWQFLDQFILNANKKGSVEKIKNNKTEIHRIKLNNEYNTSFYYTIHKKVFACSFDYSLVEKTIYTIDEKHNLNGAFATVQKTIQPNAPVVLYFKQNTFAQLLEPLFEFQNNDFWNKMQLFSDWSAAELSIKDNRLQLYGSTVADSANLMMKQFAQAENRALNSIELLPSGTFYFANYSTHADVFSRIENHPALQQTFNEIIAFSAFDNDSKQTFDYLMITYQDVASKMDELLEDKEPEFVYDDFNFSQLQDGEAITHLPFTTLDENKPIYFTKVNDKIIYTNSVEGLKKYLQKFTTKQFLSKSASFQEYSAFLAEKSVLHLYLNAQNIPQERYYLNVEQNEGNLKSFPVLGMQFSRKSTLFSFNATALFTEKEEVKSVKKWTTQLDAKPIFISSAKYDASIKSSFTIVQDEAQNVYSIDQNGNIKWKKQINGWIQNDVHPIYFNGKTGGYTFVFNTESHLYAIDNRGKDAKGFENGKKINPAVPVSVFKYEGDILRFFEITNDKHVKVYDQNGKTVSGWKIPTLKDNVVMPVHYQNFSGKEHLIFMMQNGEILITDRQGNTILEKKSGFPISSENGLLVFNKDLSTSGWALTDENGVFTIIYFDSKKKNDQVTGYPKSKLFAYQAIHSKDLKSVWLWDDKRVVLSNRSGNTQATFEILENSEKAPEIIYFNNKPYVQLWSTSENKLYLLNTELALMESFPRKYVGAAKLTDTNNDKTPELIIGEENNKISSYNIVF